MASNFAHGVRFAVVLLLIALVNGDGHDKGGDHDHERCEFAKHVCVGNDMMRYEFHGDECSTEQLDRSRVLFSSYNECHSTGDVNSTSTSCQDGRLVYTVFNQTNCTGEPIYSVDGEQGTCEGGCEERAPCDEVVYERFVCKADGTGVLIENYSDDHCTQQQCVATDTSMINNGCIPHMNMSIHFECVEGKVVQSIWESSTNCTGEASFNMTQENTQMCEPRDECGLDGCTPSCFDDCPEFGAVATLSAMMDPRVCGIVEQYYGHQCLCDCPAAELAVANAVVMGCNMTAVSTSHCPSEAPTLAAANSTEAPTVFQTIGGPATTTAPTTPPGNVPPTSAPTTTPADPTGAPTATTMAPTAATMAPTANPTMAPTPTPNPEVFVQATFDTLTLDAFANTTFDTQFRADYKAAAAAAASVTVDHVMILDIAAGSVVVTSKVVFPVGEDAAAEAFSAAPALAGDTLAAYGNVTVAAVMAPPPPPASPPPPAPTTIEESTPSAAAAMPAPVMMAAMLAAAFAALRQY